MNDFKDYLEQSVLKSGAKVWHATKSQVMQMWQNVRSNLPITPKPISKLHRGNRYDQDGIRITGSPQFIASVLSRLKDLMTYEEKMGLTVDVNYKQVAGKHSDIEQRPVFVFYFYVTEDGSTTEIPQL